MFTSFLEFGKLAQGLASVIHPAQTGVAFWLEYACAHTFDIEGILQHRLHFERLLAPGVAFFKQQACGAISVTLITWKWTVIMAGINLSFQPLDLRICHVEQ